MVFKGGVVVFYGGVVVFKEVWWTSRRRCGGLVEGVVVV